MFFRLGFQNAWRNLSRSLLAVVSMAVAAAFFTYVISLGKGYVNQAGQPLTNYLRIFICVAAWNIWLKLAWMAAFGWILFC